MASVVLVTGVSRYLGGKFARALSRDEDIARIIGVDVVPPPHSTSSYCGPLYSSTGSPLRTQAV